MRKALVLLLIVSTHALPSSAQKARSQPSPILSVQTDLRQMTVSAALVLAGYSAPPARAEAADLRRAVVEGLAGVDAELRSRLRTFYRTHRRSEVDEELDAVRYRALAFSVNLPPSFAVPFTVSQLPDDVEPLVGFGALASELYRTPQFRALVPKLSVAYDDAAARAARAAGPAVEETLAYLRTSPADRIEMAAVRDDKGNLLRPASTRLRRLKVLADPLLSAKGVTVRDDLVDAADEPFAQRPGDRYAVFAGDVETADDSAIRLAVTRFAISPIVARERDVLEDTAAPIDAIIARSERAKLRYEGARLALVTDSLVSALAVRQQVRKGRLSPNGAVDVLGVAFERGEVLALHFYDRLDRFEQVGMDVGVFYTEFLRSIDPAKERARAEQIAAARAALAAEPRREPVAGDAFAADILAADRLVTEKRFGEARPILEKILATSNGNARALFGLAQVVEHEPDAAERDPAAEDAEKAEAQLERLERAVNLYRRAALNASAREQWLASWSHVYAGRILDFLEMRDEALAEYRAAIKIGDIPQGAYREAERGVATPFEPSAGAVTP